MLKVDYANIDALVIPVEIDTVGISVPVEYYDGEPNHGYTTESQVVQSCVDDVMKSNGLRFSDAIVNDDGSGEFWIYVR